MEFWLSVNNSQSPPLCWALSTTLEEMLNSSGQGVCSQSLKQNWEVDLSTTVSGSNVPLETEQNTIEEEFPVLWSHMTHGSTGAGAREAHTGHLCQDVGCLQRSQHCPSRTCLHSAPLDVCASSHLHLFSVCVPGMKSLHDTQLAHSSDKVK